MSAIPIALVSVGLAFIAAPMLEHPAMVRMSNRLRKLSCKKRVVRFTLLKLHKTSTYERKRYWQVNNFAVTQSIKSVKSHKNEREATLCLARTV
jgi:hypothetical protein